MIDRDGLCRCYTPLRSRFKGPVPLVDTLHWTTVHYRSLMYSITYSFSPLPEQHRLWRLQPMLLNIRSFRQSQQPVVTAPPFIVEPSGPGLSKTSLSPTIGAQLISKCRIDHHNQDWMMENREKKGRAILPSYLGISHTWQFGTHWLDGTYLPMRALNWCTCAGWLVDYHHSSTAISVMVTFDFS